MERLGRNLRKLALRLGLSDAEVARRAGLMERRYGHYVSGKREPDLATLLRIAHVLGTSLDDLVRDGSDTDTQVEVGPGIERLASAYHALTPDNATLATSLVETLLAHQRGTDRERDQQS